MEADKLLVSVYEAENLDKLAVALFGLVGYLMPFEFCNLLFHPLEFDHTCRYTPVRYKAAVDAYMSRKHKHDIWLKRSPVHPGVTVVRHGDYTPVTILRRSSFYRNVLRKVNSEYGASMVAWRGKTWLATLTIMRNEKQGEFTDAHLEELEALQPHFECVIRRMAGQQESKLVNSSLHRVISGLTVASVILDWNLKPLDHSNLAAQFCLHWKHGPKSMRYKLPRQFQVPGDILEAIEEMRKEITGAKWARTNGQRSSFRRVLMHPRYPSMSAALEFLPSRTMMLARGSFLVTLNEESSLPEGTYISHKLGQLSPRERECATLAAEGMHNDEIANWLGKSRITVRNQLTSIYKKLGVDSRHKLIAAFARSHESGGEMPVRQKPKRAGTARRAKG